MAFVKERVKVSGWICEVMQNSSVGFSAQLVPDQRLDPGKTVETSCAQRPADPPTRRLAGIYNPSFPFFFFSSPLSLLLCNLTEQMEAFPKSFAVISLVHLYRKLFGKWGVH